MEWSDTAIIIIALIICLIWATIVLILVRRLQHLQGRFARQKDTIDLFDTVMRSDHRYPIWVWPDGRIQAGQNTLSILGMTKKITHISDLIDLTETKKQTVGLNQHAIDLIMAALNEKQAFEPTLLIEQGPAKATLVLDMQLLDRVNDQWPQAILWIEETKNLHLKTSHRQSVTEYETRLNEALMCLDRLPFLFWVRDAKQQLLDVNEAYVKAVEGNSIADVLKTGTEFFDIKAIDDSKQTLSKQQIITATHVAVMEGKRKSFTVTNIPLAGNMVMGVAVDKTREEDALSELTRVQESQSETLNRLSSPVAIFGPDQSLRFFNNAFMRLVKLPEAFLSNSVSHSELLDAMHETRRLPEQADFRAWKIKILKQYTDLLEPFEDMWHLPDGTAHHVVTEPHPLGGLLILFDDVTDHLALERSYNTLIAVQESTLNHMTEGVAVFGSDGHIKLSNPAFETMWQSPAHVGAGGEHVTDLVTHIQLADHLGQHQGKINQKLKSDLPIWVSERQSKAGRWKRADGMVIDYALVPLPDGSMMLTQNDITDSFQIESALRERSKALEAADRLKSEFITNMSYELRTPLNSIIGFSEMLQQQIVGSVTERQSEYLGNILFASAQLKDMISTVLDLAVLEAGEMELDRGSVDIDALVQNAIKLSHDAVLKNHVSVQYSPHSDIGTIIGDERRIKQVMYNMLTALSELGAPNTAMNIITSANDDCIFIDALLDHCTLATSERTALIRTIEAGSMLQGGRGTGLDLALVRSIIGLHQGSVALKAAKTKGLNLHIKLPRDTSDTYQETGI